MAMGMEAMGGMGVGAGTGTAAMPVIGTAIGAGIGAISSAVGDNDADKKEEARRKKERDAQLSIPGRTKASRMFDAFREVQNEKLRSMAALSQAAMEWAQLQR